MKRKLNTLFFLITIALTGIVALQVYWSVNAYHVTKTKFDADVDIAMQNAMDDCKKDYFDSIRVVLVKRLSDASKIGICIDTLHEEDTIHKQLIIYVTDNDTSKKRTIFMTPEPYHMGSNQYDYYRAMIKHKNTTVPEVLVEASFYVPKLMQNWLGMLGIMDIRNHWDETEAFINKHPNIPKDTIFARQMNKQYGIYELPFKYQQADSLKLRRYLRNELNKLHINSSFDLHFSLNHAPPQKLTSTYSETNEYTYKYHGFVFLNIVGKQFFARATFSRAEFTVLYKILAPLLLTLLLIIFTIYCFNYIIRLVIHQKKLGELKDDFINNMTHELKTPIATINVAIEGLQNFNALNDADKTKRYLQTSRIELAKLDNLVTKVLNIAAFENSEIDLVKEDINVDEMISGLISSNKLKINKQIEINYTNRDNITSIRADKLHFSNVMNNVIDNAVKYSKDPVTVDITVFREADNVLFAVKDNGIGIPQDQLKLVFDKFHRVPTGNVHNVKGTGLGLSYAQYIVNAHGGYISVKSEINKGSEFIVSIPLKNG